MAHNLLVRHRDGKEHLLPETPVPAEERLHRAFEAHPELFPTEDLGLGQIMVVGREVEFDSGKADLMYVDEDGRIVIVEFKRGTENPDSRRVVAQMLDYGAHLWRTTFEDFEAKIALPYLRQHPKAGSPPVSLREAAATQFNLEESGGPDGFAEALGRNLEKGTFTYAVVARTLPPTLNTVLEYLGNISTIRMAAITVDYYQDEDREILVPRVAFASAGVQTPPPPPKTTFDRYLEDAAPAAEFWSRFVQFLNGLSGKFYWGQKGFSYRLALDGKLYTVLRCYPRTAWWLQGKNWGDEIDVLVEARPDQPEQFRQLIADLAKPLKNRPEAKLAADGPAAYATFYVKDELPPAAEEAIRGTMERIFTMHAL